MSAHRSAAFRGLQRPMRGIDWVGYLLLALVYAGMIWFVGQMGPARFVALIATPV